jgi:hypothetical protein
MEPDAPPPEPGSAPPPEPLVELVAVASVLFFLAEHEENPGIQSFWDAFHYISTAVSVGYANVFPVTPLGKLIGGVVMMVGPSLAAQLSLAPAASTSSHTLSPAP